MKKPSVYVVVPNWNGKEHLAACLHSLQRQTVSHQVVVVDNGSSDGSAAFVKEKFPEVEVVQLKKNRGFAGGVNAGIKLALKQNAEFIALLNNDAEAHPEWLGHLLKRMKSSKHTGIVTGKLVRTNGKLDSVGEVYSIWAQPFPVGRDEADSGQYNQTRQVTAATGGGSLYRTAMLKKVGLLDESFFLYYEDVDISLRARLAGWDIWYEPKAVAKHKIGATSNKVPGIREYHRLKNTAYLYDKNMPARLFWRYLPRKLLAMFAVTVNVMAQGHILMVLKAYGVLIISVPAILVKRWQVQSKRQLTWQQFDELLYHSAPPTSKLLQKLSRLFDRKYQ